MRRRILHIATALCFAFSIATMVLGVAATFSTAEAAEAVFICGPMTAGGGCGSPDNCLVLECCRTVFVVYGCFCLCFY